MSTPPHEPITGPLGAIEPNVVLAGLEGVVTAWLAASVLRGALIPLPLPNEWRWFYLVYAIAAMLGLVLVGLVVEGVAGLVEYIVTRHLWGREKGELHRWYVRATPGLRRSQPEGHSHLTTPEDRLPVPRNIMLLHHAVE